LKATIEQVQVQAVARDNRNTRLENYSTYSVYRLEDTTNYKT